MRNPKNEIYKTYYNYNNSDLENYTYQFYYDYIKTYYHEKYLSVTQWLHCRPSANVRIITKCVAIIIELGISGLLKFIATFILLFFFGHVETRSKLKQYRLFSTEYICGYLFFRNIIQPTKIYI